MSLYLEASSILLESNGSLKSRIYNRLPSLPPLKSPPARLYALIIETLKHQSTLNEVIENSGILGLERKLSHTLALLLLHDHLLTRNGISTSTGPLKSAILKHKARLQAEFTRARLRRGHGSVAALLAATKPEKCEGGIPRWVRVNTLRSTLGAVVAAFGDDYTPVESLAEILAVAEADSAKERKGKGKVYYYKDPIVANLLAFPPGTDFTAHPLYVNGTLILQDRSSCLPAHLLAPPPGALVLDATAAPGNKTTHLAALLLDGGRVRRGGSGGGVIAFEKDARRTEVLKDMVRRAGGEDIITIRGNENFLRCDPSSEPLLSRVTHILLDPSCSGSGIVGRTEHALIPLVSPPPQQQQQGKKRKRGGGGGGGSATKPVVIPAANVGGEEEEQTAKGKSSAGRLQELSQFQKAMILHAMLFPSAVKISYSTCSVHAEENEQVVMSVLASGAAKTRGWRVERRAEGTLSEWPRRGAKEHCGEGEEGEEVAEACVRCNPIEDGGIGFFVVAFVRGCGGWGGEKVGEAEQVRVEVEEEEWKGFSDDAETKKAPKKRKTGRKTRKTG